MDVNAAPRLSETTQRTTHTTFAYQETTAGVALTKK
jgi:hypothetical protein